MCSMTPTLDLTPSDHLTVDKIIVLFGASYFQASNDM